MNTCSFTASASTVCSPTSPTPRSRRAFSSSSSADAMKRGRSAIARTAPATPTERAALAGVRSVELANLAFDVPFVAVDPQEALGQLDRFLHGFRLQDRIAADHLLGFGERSIGGRQLAAAQAHTHAFCGRTQAGGGDELALAGHVLDQLAHVLHELLARRQAALLVEADHR